MQPWSGNEIFLAQLGGGKPSSVIVVPVFVDDGVVNALYVDNGPGKDVERGDVADLEGFMGQVGRAYERLLGSS